MSTEQTWTPSFEGAPTTARDWGDGAGTTVHPVPEPTNGLLKEAIHPADLALEDSPAFLSFIESLCQGDRICLKRLLDTLERIIIVRELNRCRGNQRVAAVHLGLKYTTLNEKVKKHGLRFSKNVQSVKTWTTP